MSLAPKVILHAPVSDAALVEPFVEACLQDKVMLIAVVGEGCEKLEDLLDEIIVGDGSDPDRFILTTSHPHESLEEVLEVVSVWPAVSTEPGATVKQVRL
jgi:hypothetical protein